MLLDEKVFEGARYVLFGRVRSEVSDLAYLGFVVPLPVVSSQ